jgi:hypothetical protein
MIFIHPLCPREPLPQAGRQTRGAHQRNKRIMLKGNAVMVDLLEDISV